MLLLNPKFIAQRSAAQAKLRELQSFKAAGQPCHTAPLPAMKLPPKRRSPLLGLLRRFGKKRSVAAMALVLTGTGAQALDFKGVKLGQIPTPIEREMGLGLGQFIRCKATPGSAYSCRGDTILHLDGRELPVNTWVSFDAAGKVERIIVNFQPAFFETIKLAAFAKYGPPATLGRATLQNAFGMQVEAVEYDWSEAGTGDRASLLNYAATLDTGQLTLETAARSAQR
jgi:hypothetical protein